MQFKPPYDPATVIRDAEHEFDNRNYADASDHLAALEEVINYYEDLAGEYRRELEWLNSSFNEQGNVLSVEPFAIVENGEHVLGPADVIDIGRKENHASAMSVLSAYIATDIDSFSRQRAIDVMAQLAKSRTNTAEEPE